MADAQAAPYSRPVEHNGSHAALGDTSRGTQTKTMPAGQDTIEIVARIGADQAAANQARERYRTEPLIPITPDPRVAAVLEPGEHVVATRSSAVFEWPGTRPDPDADGELGVDLFVTTRRLLFLGRAPLVVGLNDIEEAVLSGERLLLVLRDGQGLSLRVAQPRLLRVEMATARAGIRRSTGHWPPGDDGQSGS